MSAMELLLLMYAAQYIAPPALNLEVSVMEVRVADTERGAMVGAGWASWYVTVRMRTAETGPA